MFARIVHNSIMRKSYARVSSIPMLGTIVRRIVRTLLPIDTREWTTIVSGSGSGLSLKLNPRYENDYAYGAYEPLVTELLMSHLKPGSVFYDIGAHIGIISLIAARIVGTQGEVDAFEADSENAERIAEHAVRNSIGQIHVFNNAVWHTAGLLQFERASPHSSRNQGSVSNATPQAGLEIVEIEGVTLDEFVRSHRPPDVVKVDVEGAEASVLEGSALLFETKKPILICEIHNARAYQRVTEWLSDRSYRYSWVEDSAKLPRHLMATPMCSEPRIN
jgi:FkbM family methyltransferase